MSLNHRYRLLLGVSVLAAALAADQRSNAGSFLWNVASPGANNWNLSDNWSPNTGFPGVADTAIFGAVGTSPDSLTVNNVVSVDTTVSGLSYTNTTSGAWHVTQISAPNKLTVTTNFLVGGITADNATTSVGMVGDGTLEVDANAFKVGNAGSSSSSINPATLNMTGLSNFVYNAPSGTWIVAGSGGDARAAGEIDLAAASNYITVGTINFNIGGGNNSGFNSLIQLGTGTNIFNVGTFVVCQTKAKLATVQFQSGAPATAGLRIRGVGGATNDDSRATITLGDRNNTGSAQTDGEMHLNGYPVDIKADTLTIGQDRSGGGSSTHSGIGVLQFDTGTVDATTINMAMDTTAATASSATGTLTVGANGNLIVGAGGMTLGQRNGGTAATANVGIAGTAICSNNIVKATNTAIANIDLSNGKLTMVSGVIGTPDAPIDNLTLASSTLTLPVIDASTNIAVANLNMNDTASVINFSSLPVLTGYPSVLPVISYTALGGGGSVSLGTLPGTFKGYVTNDTSNFGIYLVVTNGPATAKLDQWVGNLSSAWDTSTKNWTSGGNAVTYAENDQVAFDDTATTGTVNYTATHTPLSMTFNNNSLPYILGGTGKISGSVGLVHSGSGTVTLTGNGGDDFSGGVTVNAGTVILDNPNSAISGGVTVASGANFQVGNNDTAGNIPAGSIANDGTLTIDRSDDVGLSTSITGNGSLVKNGSGMLTLSNANPYFGLTTVSAGTLALADSGSLSNTTSVTVNNATFDLTGLPAGASTTLIGLNLNNATLNLNAGDAFSTPLTTLGSVVMSGSANTINVSALPSISSYPVTITLVHAQGGVGGFNATLGSLPAATPAYQGVLQQSVDTTQIQLKLTAGPVGTRTAVLWTGTDVPNLNTNWSDALNWQLPGEPASGDNVIFGSAGIVFDSLTINNIVDANATINTLQFTNTTSGQYHVTEIPAGVTLTVSSNMTVGGLTLSGLQTDVAMTGGGTLNVGGNSLSVGNNGTGGIDSGTVLDLSGLSNFVYNVPGGTLALGIGNRSTANLLMANGSNYITATSFNDNTTSSSSSGSGNVTLGGGTNIFNLANFNIGAGRSGSTVSFPDVTGGIRVRGVGGTDSDRAEMTIGNRNNGGGSGNNCIGSLSLDGHPVDIKLDVLTMGESGSNPSGNALGSGTLSFDQGTVDVNSIVLARSTGTTAGVMALGTINVGPAATLIVGTGGVSLGNQSASSGPAGAVLNIGGTMICSGSMIKATSLATNSITVTNGGTLKMLGGVIGAPGSPIDLLTLDTATLQLAVDGSSPATNIVATTITAANTTTINIGSVVGVTAPATVSLISYVGADPFANLALGTLPSGVTATLVDNTANSTIDLNITSAPVSTPPTIQGISFVGGNIVISGTNNVGAGGTFHVLTSTNLTTPLSNWTVLGTGSFDDSGNFNSTNTIDPTQPASYYLLRVP